MAILDFDAGNVSPSQGFTLLPIGDYPVVISESSDSIKNSKGTGEYIKLTYVVLEGEYKGRKIWENLSLVHENPITVKIARQSLSAICRCVGVMHPQDTAELHNIPFRISVGINPGNNGFKESNGILEYMPMQGDMDLSVSGRETQTPTANTPVKKKQPWE